jgi:hypothetical protein
MMQLFIIYTKGKIFCTYRADWIEEHGQYLLHEQHHTVLVKHQQLRYTRSSRETTVISKRLLGNSVFYHANLWMLGHKIAYLTLFVLHSSACKIECISADQWDKDQPEMFECSNNLLQSMSKV